MYLSAYEHVYIHIYIVILFIYIHTVQSIELHHSVVHIHTYILAHTA